MQPSKTHLLSLLAAVITFYGWLALPNLAQSQTAPAAATPSALVVSTNSSTRAAGEALAPNELVPALRTGGYVVYFRRTSTDMSQTDSGMKNFSDCANQRLLNTLAEPKHGP